VHRTAARVQALALVLLLGAAGQAAPAPHARETPIAFVSEFSDAHLSGMLSRIGGQTEARRTLSRADARILATAFDAALAAAVGRHGDAWARNLARACC
jgi:hypothetical protein